MPFEPVRRGTAGALALAAFLVRQRDPQAVMACLSSDHLIPDAAEFRRTLAVAAAAGPLLARIAARLGATPAQVVFRFARAIGILPLTGTTDPEHMRQDLAALDLALAPAEVQAIESLSG